MSKVDFIKNNFKDFYRDNGPEFGVLQGTKYAGYATHCIACMNTLTRMTKPNSILEIGSYHFHSTKSMSEGMDEYLNKEEGNIHTFEIKKGGYDGLADTTGLPKRITQFFWYPYKTSYDQWKMEDPNIAFPDFKKYDNEQIGKKNSEILKEVAPEKGYDLIFIDGDHSYEGVKRDWKHALEVSHRNTLVVFDNIWDIRLHGVRLFFDSLETEKWDFDEWNEENKHLNMVQDTGISMLY
jgi:hypothetical protein